MTVSSEVNSPRWYTSWTIGFASTIETSAGRDEQERDLAQPAVERAAEPAMSSARGEPRERREEHGGHRDGEDALREHVQAERLVDRRRRELGVEEPRREERVDEEVHVDEPDRERHREHQHEDALDSGVAPVDDHVRRPSSLRSHGIGRRSCTSVPTTTTPA